MIVIKLLCVLVLLLEADGRVYPGGRKRGRQHYNPPTPRHRLGPHVCSAGFSSGCCPGWVPSSASGLCLTPVCSFGCGDGFCIAPNVCSCRGGKQGVTCPDEGRLSHLLTEVVFNHADREGSPASCLTARCEHSCTLIGGFPVCSCSLGYSLARDGRSCHGCGEYGCDLSCNNGGCEPVSRVCPVGFTMIETSNGVACRDINECSGAACRGQCVNAEGGFVCECRAGMQLSPDRHSCIDIDECSGNRSPCQQRCQNTAGSYKCSCRAGFYLHSNGRSCVDRDECQAPGPTLCQQRCVNTPGSYSCTCRHGYRLSSDGRTCADVNECETPGLALCQHSCRNSPGSFHCQCPPGHRLHPNGRNCTDINECHLQPTRCQHLCQNVMGSYHCTCPAGYQLLADGKRCEDRNECTDGSHGCGHGCDNTAGSYQCTCEPGFRRREQGVCEDENECALPDTNRCAHNCINTVGSYHCGCRHGYRLHIDSRSCVVDLYSCQSCQRPCSPGFVLLPNGVECTDVDECGSGDAGCQHGCHNLIGSFLCTCPEGSQLHPNGRECTALPDPAMVPAPIMKTIQQSSRKSKLFAPPALETTPQAPPNTQAVASALPPSSPSTPIHDCMPPPAASSISIATSLIPNNTPQVPPTPETTPPISLPITESAALDTLPIAPPTTALEESAVTPPTAFPVPIAWPQTLFRSLVPPTELPSPQPVHTSHAEPPRSAVPLLTPALCSHGGALHPEGSSWLEPHCRSCTCLPEGAVLCHHVTCSASCSHPTSSPEQCCPSCTSCLYKGLVLDDEQTFSPEEDGCTLCLCLAGNVTCLTPDCPPVTCEQPVQSECCPLCPAECVYQGNVFLEGAEFSRPGDDCTTCVCKNGEVECSYTPCPVLDCPRGDWRLEPGECCFSCRQATVERGCSVDDNGVEFPVGQIWSPGDPCETCMCESGGRIVCRRTECLESCPHPILIPGQCCPDCSVGCSYSGVLYENSESFPSRSDPCLRCICLSGSVACSPAPCKPSCTYPFHQEGACCPVCQDCNYEGRKVLNGLSFTLESSPCTQCTCQFGEVSCEEIHCNTSCAHPYPIPGECCPTCQACLYAGQALEDGSYRTSESDPCTVCLCAEGNLECEWKGGSCPDLPCSEPLLHQPGLCCPLCPGGQTAALDPESTAHLQDSETPSTTTCSSQSSEGTTASPAATESDQEGASVPVRREAGRGEAGRGETITPTPVRLSLAALLKIRGTATAPTPTSATLLESPSPTGNLRALTPSDPPATSAQWVTPAFMTTDPETPAPSSQATPTALTLPTPTLRTVTTPTAVTLTTPTLRIVTTPTFRTVTTPTAVTLPTPTLRTVTTPTAVTLTTPTFRTVTTPTAVTLPTPTLRTVTTPTAVTLTTPTLRTITTPTTWTLATPIDLRIAVEREAESGGGGSKAGDEFGDRTAEQKPSGCWFEGLVFEEGSVFSPDSSSCLLCSCEAGRLSCLRAVCPLHPDLTALDEGQCCPTCPECQLTSDPICRANGMRFRNGTMFRREDCSECTCTAGELVCEPGHCPPLSCSPSLAVTPKGQCCPQCPGPQGCVHRGQRHQQGAVWCDGCAVCECEGSEVRCQPNPCPPLQTCLEEQDLIEAERVCCQQRGTQHYTGLDVCCPSASPES
ncbi:von Willebrand factor C and EGF domain-containing protein-like isoform X2 [Polyodon spathula]|uniref:von Willebrand factor C and EGF domain-containing protein-like isoform X2 n=1 Tax=Polyodon spathula TaxID=7913 RepID=UPI001B7DAA70|nr:von Willebrand factor C and EGF domain-containing protein-like isoform X2 [Polyodon spathula]